MKSKTLLIRISLTIVLVLASVGLLKIGQAARVSARAVGPAAVVSACGEIAASTTWLSGNVYVLSCNVWVDPGVTLTIEAGAIVKIDDFPHEVGAGDLIVNGDLEMTGTEANPVIFTSYRDDTHGGDTNGDGSSTASAGDWGSIQINSGATARLSNCDIGYAGGGGYVPALNVASSNVQVSNCHIHDNNQDGISIHGSDLEPAFENVEVANNKGYGYLIGYECCTIAGTKPSIIGGAVSNNGKTGIFISRYTLGALPTIKNLTVSGNQGDGIYIEWNGEQPWIENINFTGNTGAAVKMNADSSPSMRSLTMSGNGIDAVVIEGGTLNGGRTWDIAPVSSIQVLGDIYVNPDQFLSLPPGITLKFGAGVSMNVMGSLYAIGTAAQPVKFTGLTETPGAWKQIYVAAQGKAIFQNCDIGYGGGGSYGTYPMLYLWANQPVVIQNCRIHHSAEDGIEIATNTALIHNNEIYSNAAMGLRKTYGPPAINVIENWWGDASGPYNPGLNPSGTGNEVGNGSDAIFTPWLTAAPGAGQTVAGVILDTAGPSRISPGQTTEFAIHYTNLTADTIENAVLLMQLPRGADYLDSSNAGIHWAGREQAFWRLGSLPPGANGSVSVRVRFQWGLPIDYQDGTRTILAGSNYNQTELDVSPYLSYDPILTTGQIAISEADFATERLASTDLQNFYAAAIAKGYAYHSAYQMTYDNGQSETLAVLVRSSLPRAAIFLMHSGTEELSMTFDQTMFTLQDTTSQMSMAIPTGGTGWSGFAKPGASILAAAGGCTSASCRANCWAKLLSWNYISGQGAALAAWLVTSGWMPPASVAGIAYQVGNNMMAVLQCKYDCEDPSTHCCTGGTRWGSNSVVRLTNQCLRYDCNTSAGTWSSPVPVTCTAFGQRCMAGDGTGGGCKNCNEVKTGASQTLVCSASSVGGKPSCRDLDNRLAHDPNELIGPDGDLLPGQLVTYKITYENMGEGRAYGVYVTDVLDDSFDFDSITADASTIILPASRMLVWNVGELAPKGESGSTGEMTFTVRLKNGLPSGTVVSNQATVYFPSVPEETPTNAVVNMIQPVAAIPQSLSTLAGQPVSITLNGREAGGNPLTYTLVDPPLHGQLSGSAPNLTYTPAHNFNGSDVFTFKVINTVNTSRSAEVFIAINPNPADTTPPQVVWTSPVNSSVDTPVNPTSIYSDDTGPLYAPVIVMGLSEALDAATVTTTTVKLMDAGKQTILADVTYYGNLNQIFLTPRQALKTGAIYSVQVTKGVKDLIGNPLAADYVFSFRMARPPSIYLPLVRR